MGGGKRNLHDSAHLTLIFSLSQPRIKLSYRVPLPGRAPGAPARAAQGCRMSVQMSAATRGKTSPDQDPTAPMLKGAVLGSPV